MKHLAPGLLADLAERPRQEASDPHLDNCDQCRRAVDDLRAVLESARRDEVPEPSPLFWDHFSARVRNDVNMQPESKPRSWTDVMRASRLVPAGLVASVVLVVLIGFGLRLWPPRVPASMPPPDGATQPAGAANALPFDDDRPDASWALVTELAGDVDWDAASAIDMGPAPGSADRAAGELSSAEQIELVRLIRMELGHSSS